MQGTVNCCGHFEYWHFLTLSFLHNSFLISHQAHTDTECIQSGPTLSQDITDMCAHADIHTQVRSPLNEVFICYLVYKVL